MHDDRSLTAVMASVEDTGSSSMAALSPRAQAATFVFVGNNGRASPTTPRSPAEFDGPRSEEASPPQPASPTSAKPNFHVHRLNHSASKLPAFRFADLTRETLVLPSRLQRKQMPPAPVSPDIQQTEPTEPTEQAEPKDCTDRDQNETEPKSPPVSALVSHPRPVQTDPPVGASASAAGAGAGAGAGSGAGSGSGSVRAGVPAQSDSSIAPSLPRVAFSFALSPSSPPYPAPASSPSARSFHTFQNRALHSQQQVPVPAQDTQVTQDTRVQQPDLHTIHSHQNYYIDHPSSSQHTSSSSPSSPSTAVAIAASSTTASSFSRLIYPTTPIRANSDGRATSSTHPTTTSSLSPSLSLASNRTPKFNSANLFHDSPPRVVISAASTFSSPASAPSASPRSPLQSPLSPRSPSPSRSPSRSPSSPSSPRLQRTLTYPSPTHRRTVPTQRRVTLLLSANSPDSAGPKLASPGLSSRPSSPSSPLPPGRPLSGLSTKEWAKGQRDLILTNSTHTSCSSETAVAPPTAYSAQYQQHQQHQQHQSQESQESQQSRQSQQSDSSSQPSQSQPSQPLPDERRKTASRPPVSFRRPRNDGGSTSRNSSIGSIGSSSSPTTTTSATSVSVSIPPIRSFRSSGSRKSLGLDGTTIMSLRSPGVGAAFDDVDNVDGGGVLDPHQRDHALRTLEGRADDLGRPQAQSQVYSPRRQHGTHYYSHSHSHSQSALRSADPDTTADIFMRIARDDDPALSRLSRQASQRRPFSAAVPAHQNSPPPQVTRRLSDQRDTVRQRRYADDQVVRQPASTVSLSQRDAAPRIVPGERATLRSSALPHRPDPIRTRTVVSATRPSPTSSRTSVLYDTASEVGTAYARRRPSVDASINNNPPLQLRASSIKTAHNFSRTYNSSPLVPRHTDGQKEEGTDNSNGNGNGGAAISTQGTGNSNSNGTGTGTGTGNGAALEGTESSASTAAPSTVWDELDDLKSRMRRLELSGKIPPTAGAAMSRVSDDRPRTATTSATNVSGSPKRATNSNNDNNNNNSQVGDHRSTTSSSLRQQQQQQQSQQQQHDQQSQLLQSPRQRDVRQSFQNQSQNQNQAILQSALNKARPHISDDIISAIEAAAAEAMSLSQMVGVAGQPGPISSGASSIGTGMPATVTDRQLRRKAESICRSLTELCLALNDEAAQRKVKATTAAAVAAAHANVSAAQSPATHTPSHQSQQPQQQQQQQQQSQQSQQSCAPSSSSSQPTTTSAPSSQHPQQHTTAHSHSQSQPQQSLQIQTHQLPRDDAGLISPTNTTRAFASLANSRRAAAVMEQPAAPKVLQASPRTLTRHDDRRATFLTTPTLPVPRSSLGPPMSSENVGRRSSLMFSRKRRSASEEPEEQLVQNAVAASRRSSLLTIRRAATEEPEDMSAAGRKTSLLTRTRRSAVLSVEAAEDEDQDTRATATRSSSRAVTEVAALRTAREYHRHQPREYLPREYASTRDYAAREYPSQTLQTSRTAPQLSSMTNGNGSATTILTIPSNVSTVGYDNMPVSPTIVSAGAGATAHANSLASSALPRRRLVPSSLNSRLVTPQTTTTTATTMTAAAGSTASPMLSSRRFLERSAPERELGDRDRDAGAPLASADKHAEERLQERLHERVQRQLSMGQTASSLLGRTATVSQSAARRPNMSSAASQVGGYR